MLEIITYLRILSSHISQYLRIGIILVAYAVFSVYNLSAQRTRSGIYVFFHPNGKVAWKGEFLNGRRQGLYAVYHENGKLNWQAEYKNDKRNGYYVSYQENGKLILKAYYRNDVLHGSFEEHYPSGKIKIKTSFQNGVIDGEYKLYNDSTGKLIERGNYINGRKIGIWHFYDQKGKFVEQIAY